MLFLKAYGSLHSVNSTSKGLKELPLQGSSHQPARERRGVDILRARSIPHLAMGAAILNVPSGTPAGGEGEEGGTEPRLRRKWAAPQLVRPGPGQYGYGVPAPGKVAGAASFVASRGDKLRLRLRPLPSRRYPRPHAVEGGVGVGEKGA